MSTLLAVKTTIVLTAIGVDYTLKMWKNIQIPVSVMVLQVTIHLQVVIPMIGKMMIMTMRTILNRLKHLLILGMGSRNLLHPGTITMMSIPMAMSSTAVLISIIKIITRTIRIVMMTIITWAISGRSNEKINEENVFVQSFAWSIHFFCRCSRNIIRILRLTLVCLINVQGLLNMQGGKWVKTKYTCRAK